MYKILVDKSLFRCYNVITKREREETKMMKRLVAEDIIINKIIDNENNKPIEENENNIYPNKKIKKVVDKIILK